MLLVTASSSQGYADELGAVGPEFGPQSAVNGNGTTQWRSGSFEPPDQQWLDLRLEHPTQVVASPRCSSSPGRTCG